MEPHSDFKPWYYWPFSKRTTVLALTALGLFILVFQVNKMLTSSFRIEIFGVEILEVEHLDGQEAPPEIEPAIRQRIEVRRVPLPPPPPLLPMPPDEPEEVPEVREEGTFVVVEQMPELIGGLRTIQSQVRYPEIAKRAGISGRVIIQFIVDKQGRVQTPEVVRGIGGGCDEEAVRVISQARFRPGKQRGKPVKVKMSLPITFRLGQ